MSATVCRRSFSEMTDHCSSKEPHDCLNAPNTLRLDSLRSFSGSTPPTVLSAETIPLESLVHHQWSVPDDTPFDAVHEFLREHKVDFLALIRNGRVVGICSRGQLGFMLGSRYGFALFSRSPAHLAQVAHPLIFARTTPVLEILARALARQKEEFHEDVILIDEDCRLIGLIPVEALAHLQSRLVGEQLGELRRQHELLQQQNLEHFQTNHALRQTQALYQGVFASNPLGLALLDTQGVVQTHNRRFVELLNVDENPGAKLSLISLVIEREHLLFQNLLQAHERHHPTSAAHEFTLHVAGRGPRLFRFNTRWISETSQICACLEDISDQRSVERHLRRQEKQLLLDTLVGGIAHELNNKLTPVMGFSELLEPTLDERSQLYVSYINKSVVEAAHIIRQLLQLSKPDSGHPEIVDLRRIVEESLVMLKFQLREAGVRVQTDLPSSPVNVLADSAQIKQVLMNLAINSVHAMTSMPDPELGIAVIRRENVATIVVRDNGIGIAPEIMGRIFDPFFTTKSPDKGSGLGLSICFSIVRKYGGDISVESEPGQGASFTVEFPVAVEVAPDSTPREIELPVQPGQWADCKVLVVEDEEVLRKLLQEVIRSHFGCRVDAAVNGSEGLTQALRDHYDLIVSDIRMPELSGIELYLRLRELQPATAGRFIFVSGRSGDEQFNQEVKRWNVPLVAKPFTMARLTTVCMPFLRAASARH